jgi:hypothetical protein
MNIERTTLNSTVIHNHEPNVHILEGMLFQIHLDNAAIEGKENFSDALSRCWKKFNSDAINEVGILKTLRERFRNLRKKTTGPACNEYNDFFILLQSNK